MENQPIDEWEYWDREISTEELEKIMQAGQAIIAWPENVNYRIKQIKWNNRIKKRFRQMI